MSLNYAKRMDNIRASEIRELLKLTQQPGIISFAGGLPAPESFPVEEFIKIGKEVLENTGTQALQYGPTEGYGPLREAIAKRMEKVKVDVKAENILITSGSQQGLDFAAKIFINPGDIIVCESPTYLGAINAFKAYEPKFIEVSTDKDGMNMEELEEVLKNNDKVKFIYVIPDFQNPSGKTWTVERRMKLIELANKYNVAIIEDNPYGELRFEGEILPAVKHFDTEGRVAFLGTFSKILCPGLRLGWVAADTEFLNKFILVKQGADLQSSTISQMETAKFLELYDIDNHIQKIIDLYRVRRDLMMKTIEEEFPEGVTYTYPEGGLFTWVVLPEYMNARELALKALEENVAYVPGGSFFPNGGNENTFRLNYSNMDEEKIVEGIKRLGKVIREAVK
ncbi:PLP-dependent aminotransferase family protein [Tissierella pigra]|uniref:PLP-dependent aminotransferase family protein n=1 Tax=Tissierella pigra TaxID=2607614 RepID=A0A6N7XZL7_9FIRM|nr:PLP-dependent aminotransferase family protein [Tissierella pigra]MBU5428344.1 PLP-dependent aminotransferase family protein [Tissierella pigra]MSU01668.1 PLP-dependent aminotransferase family protein [Tissierella pigra]